MVVKFIKNDNLMLEIEKILSNESLYKLLILGSVDDYMFNKLSNMKIAADYLQYISVGKKYTTYKMLEGLLQNDNTYIYNNNLHKKMKKENIIFSESDTEIEVLVSSFEFVKENIENSTGICVYIKGEKDMAEMKEVINLYNYYKNNEDEYEKLNKEVLSSFDKNKDFRNDKVNTIFEELQMDEIISSFRNKENAYKNILAKEEKISNNEEIEIDIEID